MNQHASADHQLLGRLTETIEKNLQNEQFGVSGLATAAGLSKSQLNRRLKALTGQSCSQFVREYRLKKAKELLQSQAATPTEVAYQVGFGSPSYFSTCFKEFYGYSPGEVSTRANIETPQAQKSNWKKISMVTMGLMVLLSVAYFSFGGRSNGNQANDLNRSPIRIAVLPVKNFADSSANTIPYLFAQGITSKLSKVDAVEVITNTFAENMEVREVGNMLNADFLLGITFVLAEEEFDLLVNMTDARDGTVIWSEPFQRPTRELQDIQNEVVAALTRELGVEVTAAEVKQVNQKLTQSDSAYRYYLIGNDYLSRNPLVEENMRMAANLFEKAVTLDSAFAKAWMGLYSANQVIYGRYFDRTEAQYQKVQQYFEKAKSLDPELLQIRIQMSEEMNRSEQLLLLKKLLRQYPENDTIYKKISGIFGSMDQTDSALYYVGKAIEFNPKSAHHLVMAGVYHWRSRRYSKALEYYLEALMVRPTLKIPHPAFIYVDLGELDMARKYLTARLDEGSQFKVALSYIACLDRNFDRAVTLMKQADSITSNYHSGYRTRSLELGLIYHTMGDLESAQVQFEQARYEMISKLVELPDDPRVLSSLGVAYAGLGLKMEALKSVQKALHLAGTGRTGYIQQDFLLIYLMVGEFDQAMEQLGNSNESYWELKWDPLFDPLRERADFQALIANAKEVDGLQRDQK